MCLFKKSPSHNSTVRLESTVWGTWGSWGSWASSARGARGALGTRGASWGCRPGPQGSPPTQGVAFPFACLMDGLNTIITILLDPTPTQALLVASDRKAIIIRNLSVARPSRTKYSMHTHTRQHGFFGLGRGLIFFVFANYGCRTKQQLKIAQI